MGDDDEMGFLHKIGEVEDSICRSMHHLSTACGNSGKRHSSVLEEPSPKRATPNPTSAGDFFGFKKLSLPSTPPLRRTFSEPVHSPDFSEIPTSPAPIQETFVAQESAPPTSSPGFKKPSPPPLRRTISEPIHSPHCAQFLEIPTSPAPIRYLQPRQEMSDINGAPIPVFAGTPQRPPARRNPSKCAHPSSKRLKRIKERMREMSQWWNQVASEEDDFTDDDPKEVCEDDPSQEAEAVFVEKTGECTVLHFKCPCGSGYQILLSGNNCYYKLTNFRN